MGHQGGPRDWRRLLSLLISGRRKGRCIGTAFFRYRINNIVQNIFTFLTLKNVKLISVLRGGVVV